MNKTVINKSVLVCALLPFTAFADYVGKNVSALDNVVAETSSTTTNAWLSVAKDTHIENYREYAEYSLLRHNHAGKVSHQVTSHFNYDFKVHDVGLSQGANETGRTATIAMAAHREGQPIRYVTHTQSPYQLHMLDEYDFDSMEYTIVPPYDHETSYYEPGMEISFQAVNAQTVDMTSSFWRIKYPYDEDSIYSVRIGLAEHHSMGDKHAALFALPPLEPERVLGKPVPFVESDQSVSSVRIDFFTVTGTEATGVLKASGNAVVSVGLKKNPNYGLRCTLQFEMMIEENNGYDVLEPYKPWSCAIKNNINL